MKKHLKINTIITGILKAECKNLPQTYFIDHDGDWVKSDMILNENFYYKDFLHLVETGNEKFSKSIFLFLKQFFTESGHQDIHNHHHCHHFYVYYHHQNFPHHCHHHPYRHH